MTKTDHLALDLWSLGLSKNRPRRSADLHRGIYSYFGYNNPLSIWNF